MKKTFYSELAYVIGLVLLALATACMERASFGMSMVVAPAYILHLKLSQFFPAFSFGMAEYCLQLILIILLSIALRKLKKGYFFSFVTAFVYGLLLDMFIALLSHIPADLFAVRCVFFVFGMLVCALGVALLFNTYFAPEAYELVVKEITDKYSLNIGKVKTAYDLISLGLSVLLSFCFFGFMHFEGVKLGTLITALLNGFIISKISAYLSKTYNFTDRFPLRKCFEG